MASVASIESDLKVGSGKGLFGFGLVEAPIMAGAGLVAVVGSRVATGRVIQVPGSGMLPFGAVQRFGNAALLGMGAGAALDFAARQAPSLLGQAGIVSVGSTMLAAVSGGAGGAAGQVIVSLM